MAIKKGFLEKRLTLPAVFAGNEAASKKRMSRAVSDGASLQKKNEDGGGRRFLVTIEVVGSAGPIRFVVNGDENVKEVIQKALKHYARERRVPQLGSDSNTFSLYPTDSSALGELDPTDRIESSGEWKFGLCKKDGHPPYTTEMINKSKVKKWVSWLPKSKSFPMGKQDAAPN